MLYLPKVFYRRFFQDRYKEGGLERLGYVSRRTNLPHCIWIHAVSVGEVNAAKLLIQELTSELPDYEIVISTTTDTGYARAKALYGERMSVFYYPLDFSWSVKRALDRIKPDVCILVELEVWPNFARLASQRGIGLVVFNGRISDESFPRYKKVKPIAGWMFSMVNVFLVQTRQYKNRFTALGVEEEKIIITGSVKYDTAGLTANIAGSNELADKLNVTPDQRLIVAGGTGNGEEIEILKVFKALREEFENIRLAIVPRKPERFNEVASLIQKEGFELLRYSELKGAEPKERPSARTVILGDTMGDLKKFYSLAELVFVGRSLTPMGGSDMMESTAMGKFTAFGIYTFNFNQTVEALLDGCGAVQVNNAKELEEVFAKALRQSDYKEKIAKNGRKVIEENQGATEKSVKVIKEIIYNQEDTIK